MSNFDFLTSESTLPKTTPTPKQRAIATPPLLAAIALPVARPPWRPDPVMRALAYPPLEAAAEAFSRTLPVPDADERATTPVENELEVTCA